MWPVLIHLGRIQVTWWIIFLILVPIWSSFLMWNRLRDDFPDEEIFTFYLILLFFIVAGALAGGWAEWGRFGAISGWGMVIAGVAALWRWCSRKKWDFWEMSDFITILALWVWLIGSIAWGPEAKWGIICAAVGIVLVSLVKNNYKKIRWYKSGKVGLTGLVAVFYFSVSQISVAMMIPTKVYWGGLTASQWVSSWTLAFTLVGIYIRAGRRIKEEPLWLLIKHKNE